MWWPSTKRNPRPVHESDGASTVTVDARKPAVVSHLVIDVGTSNLRTLLVHPDGSTSHENRALIPAVHPFVGAVEFDPAELAATVIALANATLRSGGPVASVGITTQRASTIVWDRATGVPVANGIGWQDLRTAGMCVMAGAMGKTIAPNQSATKVQFLFDSFDSARERALCFGTVDSWIIWTLTNGREHVIEASNAAVTGLIELDPLGNVVWSDENVAFFCVPPSCLPRIVPSVGQVAPATALDGAPMITGVIGDQQSSLIGQSCVRPGMAKFTFGTGAMFDMLLGSTRPAELARSIGGTFPIVTWSEGTTTTFGLEAIDLAAGSCVSWLCEDLAIISSPAESEAIAGRCEHTDGVMFVPALLGLGTPEWDYGARGTLVGLTRGTGRPEIVRAVLEGVANRGADLLEAAESDSHRQVASLRVDGGMSANSVFVQALADATTLPVEVSPVLEATALGAGYLAGVSTGTWTWDDIASMWSPARIVQPTARGRSLRSQWHDALRRSREWHPDLSALKF